MWYIGVSTPIWTCDPRQSGPTIRHKWRVFYEWDLHSSKDHQRHELFINIFGVLFTNETRIRGQIISVTTYFYMYMASRLRMRRHMWLQFANWDLHSWIPWLMHKCLSSMTLHRIGEPKARTSFDNSGCEFEAFYIVQVKEMAVTSSSSRAHACDETSQVCVRACVRVCVCMFVCLF